MNLFLILFPINLAHTHFLSLYLQKYLTTWDKYREIWEINKDLFIRRYARLNPPVSSFDADTARYSEVANNVQTQVSHEVEEWGYSDVANNVQMQVSDKVEEWGYSDVANNVQMQVSNEVEDTRKYQIMCKGRLVIRWRNEDTRK